MELKKGASVKLTTDPAFMEKGTTELIYVDYVNICKVVHVNSHVYVDDGLISLIVKEIGMPSQISIIFQVKLLTCCLLIVSRKRSSRL